MSFLNGYNDGDNIMLLDTIYHRAKKKNGKYGNDKLSVIFKDLDTGKKQVQVIEKPEIDIYFTKEGIEYENYQPHIPIDKVEKHTVPYSEVEKYIAEMAGKNYVEYFYKCIRERNFKAKKNIHKYRHVHSSDIDVEDAYRIKFLKAYKPKDFPISKSFGDIEIDLIDSPTTEVDYVVEQADCPVNVATIIHKDSRKSYTFILRNEKNPQIAEFEDDIDDFKRELDETFSEKYGKLEYNIIFYDDEVRLIKDMFVNIHILKPDFLLFWNMAFDIRYLINRLKKLGVDPASIMCHPDFEEKECYYYYDTRHFKIAEKGDYFRLSAYTVIQDQMINYGVVRKGTGELKSHKLTYVAKEEIGDEKLDYSEEGDIKHFPWINFRKFVLYNIKDVLLQVGIENKTEDLNTIYVRSYYSGTRYTKIFRQSVLLKNYAHIYYPEIGYILGNNKNIDYGYIDEPDSNEVEEENEMNEKFEGAIDYNWSHYTAMCS